MPYEILVPPYLKEVYSEIVSQFQEESEDDEDNPDGYGFTETIMNMFFGDTSEITEELFEHVKTRFNFLITGKNKISLISFKK